MNETSLTVNPADLIYLIGLKETENTLLRKQVQELTAQLATIKAKVEGTPADG